MVQYTTNPSGYHPAHVEMKKCFKNIASSCRADFSFFYFSIFLCCQSFNSFLRMAWDHRSDVLTFV